MSKLCMLTPNQVKYLNGNIEDGCKITNKVEITQNLFNYNHIFKNNISERYPVVGLMPQGPATGSWPCRNQVTCNYFDENNPIIPEHIRKIDVLSLPPN